MLFLRSWLEEYIDLSAYTNTDLVNLITGKSSEVEEAKEISDYFEGKALIGRIENSRAHAQADRLKIFDVNLGSKGKIQIVSAAPNVSDGMYVPVAIEGCKLPFLTIAPRKMRGEASEGMCMGMSELMLETEHSHGLWELNEILKGRADNTINGLSTNGPEVFLGQSICLVLPEFFPAETVLDIKVLPDKIGTIGNHLGMAIELAVCLGKSELLKPAANRFLDSNYDILGEISKFVTEKSPISLEFTDQTDYTNNFWLFDLKIDKSNDDPNYYLPHEFTKRMFLTARHVVGGLADLSNYLLADMGQPTHYFSQEKTLTDGSEKWTVKTLESPTKFQGLGQLKDIDLPAGVQVIADEKNRILAIPAISGGDSTKTDVQERAILLEIANFEANQVARNSFILKQRSEGSKIWAGKVRQTQILACLLRTIEVLHAQDSVAFQITSILHWSRENGHQDMLSAGRAILDSAQAKTISVDVEFIASRLDNRSLEFWKPQIEAKLSLLGSYSPESKILKPNIYFTELNDKYDLYLDVSRLIGFDQYHEHSLRTHIDNLRTPLFPALEKIRQEVRQYGFDEVITRPFVAEKQVFETNKSLEVIKAYRSQEPFLRDRLVYSLAGRLTENLQRGEKEPKIFELNRVYTYSNKVEERLYLAGLVLGNQPYLLTSLGQEILGKASLEGYKIKQLDKPLNQLGQGYFYDSGTLDYRICQLGNAFKKDFGLPTAKGLWYFEFDLTNWDLKMRNHPFYTDEINFPPVVRDYSLSVPKSLQWQEVFNLAESVKLESASLFVNPVERFSDRDARDILNFQVRFLNPERTLTGDEVNSWQEKFVSELQKIAEVELR